jgi:hypothetical protein
MKAFIGAVIAAVVISVGMHQILIRMGFSATGTISAENVRLDDNS